MLQLILITTNTGVPKFKKSLITDLDRDIFLRLSNLIVTLYVKSKREVDHKLSYFELNNRGVTIEENTQTKLLCILMHDISDVCYWFCSLNLLIKIIFENFHEQFYWKLLVSPILT